MSAPTEFSPALLGQTEKALNAILEQQLDGTGLTEPQWVALVLTVTDGAKAGRDELAARVAHGLKVDEAQARDHLEALAAAGLVQLPDDDGSPVTATGSGQRVFGRVREAVGPITERMWGDLPAEDLATAGRVLSVILERADAELAA